MSLIPAPGPAAGPAPPAAPRLSAARLRTAWLVALAADAIQWVLLPLFAPGLLSPADDLLDVVVGITLWRLIGWHWALLPSFAIELVPGADLAPCWLVAVAFATRGKPPGSPRRT